MPDQRTWLKRPRLYFLAGGVITILVLAGAGFGLVRTQAAPPQPFPYPHSPHIKRGIPCTYCHSGAYCYQSASLPTKAKCQGCHANMATDTPRLEQWADFARANTQVQWVPVAMMPDFVYFSHQPHIAAGVSCETCHGDVGRMEAAVPVADQNMGWCLNCHQNRAPQHFVRLSDCATCHQ